MRCSRTFWQPEMRSLIFCTLLLAHAGVSAGVLEKCQAEKNDADAVQLCIETAQMRSTNQLRKVSAAAKATIRNKTQHDGSKAILREYRLMEARHVRERSSQCRKQLAGLDRMVCIADMNYAHIEQLARFHQDDPAATGALTPPAIAPR